MTWLMTKQKIQQKELNQTKFYEIKHLKLQMTQNMMVIIEVQHQWFTSFFDKKSSGSGVSNEPNYQLAEELHKPIIKKFKERQVYSSFRGNIQGVDLADIQSLSKYNKTIKYLLCAIDLFRKYAWVVPLKNKRGISIVNAF